MRYSIVFLLLLLAAANSMADWTCGGVCIRIYNEYGYASLKENPRVHYVAETGDTQAKAYHNAIAQCGAARTNFIYVLGTVEIVEGRGGKNASVGKKVLTLNEACTKN